MDPSCFQAPYISKEEIWRKADQFRQNYWPQQTIPVDVYDIIEFGLDIEIRPVKNLRQTGDTDALLLGNLSTIIIDSDDFYDDRMQNRVRFSLAHELGHLVLHADVFRNLQHSSIDEWIKFMQCLPEREYDWIEFHAYEFAGRLLVPSQMLRVEFDNAVTFAKEKGFTDWDETGISAVDYIASHICRKFDVSSQVIERRIKREELRP